MGSLLGSIIFKEHGKQNDVLLRFGSALERRTKLGVSQEAFADRCKLDRTYISGIECGKRNVSLRNIEVIAKTLGISLAELMQGGNAC